MKLKKELRVAISGKSGCGNTTVSTLLSQKLGIKLINYTFRQLAAEKGLTLAQVIENAKNDDFYDKYVDTHQVELAEKESCVLGSRLAIYPSAAGKRCTDVVGGPGHRLLRREYPDGPRRQIRHL